MALGRKKIEPTTDEPAADPTGWLLTSGIAEVLIMNTAEIKYMCMLFYTFFHGGGILVPLFINAIPVTLSTDAYPITIACSFILHQYFPMLREIVSLSPVFKAVCIILYETMRAFVVCKMTMSAGKAIEPSDFSIAVFGPIICGGIAGCGGAFLPFDKGLEAIETTGLADNMTTALIAATFYNFFKFTSLSDGVVDAHKKAQLLVAVFFISHNLYTTFGAKLLKTVKKEKAKKE